jgi:hypothetical protein
MIVIVGHLRVRDFEPPILLPAIVDNVVNELFYECCPILDPLDLSTHCKRSTGSLSFERPDLVCSNASC